MINFTKCITASPKYELAVFLSLNCMEHPNFERINRSEIVNLNAVDVFEGNCYYIGKKPQYATGDYWQRMEGVFVKAKQQ